ncbi:ammonia channel protein [Paramagnetospirillum kuznetsovii]|uniref:Ammonium transporter n=1 Tax=Paramagnetospirillum kuznetsovii TaxID=2053833 RepID=A0A364P3T1_9PROT|nr:ammonia channel protein [Paramagnetospirillum kuznetsovii]
MKTILSSVSPALGLTLAATAAWAEEAAAPAAAAAAPVVLDTGATAWMLTSTALVLMMTIPGLALFYGGMVRKKNLLATMMQSFAVTCLVTVLWAVIGYSLAFTGEGAFVGGMDRFLLNGLTKEALALPNPVPESVFMMFQMTFAIITPALITGAFADRMKFSSMLVFMALWLLIVYAPICHWVWMLDEKGGAVGFLAKMGVLDFAGGTVVHINAGVAGLVACLVLGPRKGYGTDNMAPHNLSLSIIGASLLWVGWFGFNAGSAVAADGRAGMAMTVTQIATAAAAMSWMLAEWILRKKPSALGIISGAVAGLVAITPASGFVDPKGALIIGLIAGVVCYWGATGLKHALKYDDSLDAFGVHGIGGITGAILTGVFAVEKIGGTAGLLEGNSGQVMTQVYGVLITLVYTAVVSFILLKVIDMVMGLRVTAEEEREGLDLALHGETVH